MTKMLAAAHGKNQVERPECCLFDDPFRAPGMKRYRKHIQRRRERRAWQRDTTQKQEALA